MDHVEQPTPAPKINLVRAPSRPYALTLWLGGSIVALDQATKAVVRWSLDLHDSVTVIPGLMDITHVRNTGAAFGILNAADFPFKSAVMLVIALAAFAAIAYFSTRLTVHETLARAGLTLVLAGAGGNLIDRATVGYVTDFVDVYWRDWHFWAFNVADAAITIGAALVILDLLVAGRHAPRTV